MSISFTNTPTEEIKQFIKIREELISKFNIAWDSMKNIEAMSYQTLRELDFSIRPEFQEVFDSIASYVGIYTIELTHAKKELEKRNIEI